MVETTQWIMEQITADQVAAFAAILAAFAALWGIRQENKRGTLTLSVDLTERYLDNFESDTMIRKRKNAAKYVLQATDSTGDLIPTKISDEGSEDLIEVLNLFDSL